MLFTDEKLSFSLTISHGIDRQDLLDILGRIEALPSPQSFDDYIEENNKPRKRGLLNVFEDGDHIVTLENNGLLGATRRSMSRVVNLTADKAGHYICIYHSSGDAGYQYVEIQDGLVLANFDALSDPPAEAVEEFFPSGVDPLEGMIRALEYRMETTVKPEWFEKPTDTYIIDYHVRRD